MLYLPVALSRTIPLVLLTLKLVASASLTITVASPTPGSVGTPTFFDATATTSSCPAGIAAMRIYTAPGVHPFTTKSPHLETFLDLKPGTYNIVIQAWDNCGGIGKFPIALTVQSVAGVHLFLPSAASGTTPVHVAASAENPACAGGMSAMRIYTAPGEDLFTNKGGTINTFINLRPGTHTATAQAWDNCGNVFKGPVAIDVTGGTFGKFLYVPQGDRNNIAEFRLKAGTITNPAGSGNPPPQFPLPAAPTSFAVDPSGNFAYAGLTDGRITIFTINRATGALSRRTTIPGPASGGASLIVDRSGNFLFTIEFGSDIVASYRINRSTGALTFVGTVQTGSFPVAITTDWRGRYVYVGNQFSSAINDYLISTLTGQLVPLADNPVPTDPDQIAIAATDRVMYALSLSNNSASGFTIGPNGALSPVPGSPFFLPNCCGQPYSLAIDPIHNFLFYLVVGNGFFGSGGLFISRVRPDGSIINPGTNIDPVSLAPQSVALDPSYKFVYTCDMEGKPRVVSFGYATGGPVSQQSTLRPAAFPVQITASP
jgi:DNA-binding beta-propeller fold protein YncE